MTIRDLEVPIGDAAQVRKALEVIRSKATFICDFILGKPWGDSGKPQQQDMFDFVT